MYSERRQRTWQRLLRRRANRAERGLPMDITRPVPEGSMDEPLPPAETVAAAPRPASATIAGIVLAVLGVTLAVTTVAEVGPPVVEVATTPAVDGLTAIFQWVVAAFLAGVLLALLVIAAVQLYAGWRILRGVNWGFVEGLAAAVVGTLTAAVHYGLTVAGEPIISPALVAALAGYAVVILSLVMARPWFGEIRFPLHPDRAPWWLRLSRHL